MALHTSSMTLNSKCRLRTFTCIMPNMRRTARLRLLRPIIFAAISDTRQGHQVRCPGQSDTTAVLPGIVAWILLAALCLVRFFSWSVRGSDGERRLPPGHMVSWIIARYPSHASAETADAQRSRIFLQVTAQESADRGSSRVPCTHRSIVFPMKCCNISRNAGFLNQSLSL